MEVWNQYSKPAPLDDEGYMTTFEPDHSDEWLEFLSRYGFVVLDIFSPQQCERTIDEFWEQMRAHRPQHAAQDLDRNDFRTWESENWPTRSKFLSDMFASTQAAYDNRTNPVLYEVFSKIFGGEKRLWSHVDCWGVFRGTSFLDEGIERPDWRWQLEPHWDVDPWSYVQQVEDKKMPRMYQGLIALNDCYERYGESTGGFRVCPGSAPHLSVWCKKVPRPLNLQKESFHVSKEDAWYKRLQKVPLRQGSVVIWDSGSLHANFANTSRDMRIVQYVRMMPTSSVCDAPNRQRLFPQNQEFNVNDIELSPLGRKLLGLDEWDEQ